MKRLQSIQFKVFICLFISFMMVFGYVVKNKYDQNFNELVYNTDYTASDDYINFCNNIDSRNPNQVELDLQKIKKELSNLPKDNMTEICLLDANGKLIEQYGYNKKDRLLITSDLCSEGDNSNDYYDINYYIDLSELSDKQYKLLKDTIKDVNEKNYEDIDLSFEGHIEELQNFKETSSLVYNAKSRYFKVTPTFIHYNTDIFGAKKENLISATLEAYVDDGEYHLSNHGEAVNNIKNVSTLEMYQMCKDAINNHFSNIYVRLASFLDKDTIISKENKKMTNEIASSIKEGSLTYATFTKLLDDYSYQVLLTPLYKYKGYTEGQEHAPEAYVAIFYDFQSGGRSQLRNDLIKNNFLLLLGGCLFIILFSYFISYMTTKRIKEIDRVAMEITNNNFEGVLDTKGHDELSSLSSHINTMSSNLKRNIDALNLEIDQVKKMEQLRKEFIAQFTHEIKTPLAIINGNIDLLENVDDEIRKEKYIEVINKEIAHINDLILQMLDLSRLEAKAITLDKKEIDLRELTEDIIDDYEQLLMEKKLKVEIQGEDVLIVGDRKRIEMVIQNYLSNAIKHAFINSTIKIKIKENEFSIENRGKQIDENRMDTIWESFVSDDQKGTGLGLAIVRNILELHEMTYGVVNLDDGVKFYFRWLSNVTPLLK